MAKRMLWVGFHLEDDELTSEPWLLGLMSAWAEWIVTSGKAIKRGDNRTKLRHVGKDSWEVNWWKK